VVTLKVNANATSSTLEQVEGRRKDMILAAGKHMAHEIESKLKERMESEEMRKLLVHRPVEVYYKIPDKLVASIVGEVKGWVAEHGDKAAEWYNDEWQYARATRELMQLEGMAMDKFQRWVDMNDSEEDRLSTVRRRVESQKMARLDAIIEGCAAKTAAWVQLPSVVSWGPGSMSRGAGRRMGEGQEEAAPERCRRREILISSLDEQNDVGEPPMVAAAAKGDVVNLKLLLAAGGRLASV